MRLKDLTCGSDRVGNNSDIMHVVICYSRNETYVDDHELGFNKCDIHSLALELISDTVVVLDMGDCMYNIGLFDSTICDNSRIVGEVLRLVKDIIKILHVLVDILRGGRERRVKGYSTKEIINYP